MHTAANGRKFISQEIGIQQIIVLSKLIILALSFLVQSRFQLELNKLCGQRIASRALKVQNSTKSARIGENILLVRDRTKQWTLIQVLEVRQKRLSFLMN